MAKFIDFNSEDGRKKVESQAKVLAMVVGFFWVILAGSDYLKRQNLELSKESIPVADTQLEVNWSNRSAPYGEPGEERNCYLTGKYTITNAGDLLFNISQVEFALYRMADVPNPVAPTLVESVTVQPRLFPDTLADTSRMHLREQGMAELVDGSFTVLNVDENLGPNNRLERTFAWLVRDEVAFDPNNLGSRSFARIRQTEAANVNYNYVVVADASGGLPDKEGGILADAFEFINDVLAGSYSEEFGENDLQHISAIRGICWPDSNSSTNSGAATSS